MRPMSFRTRLDINRVIFLLLKEHNDATNT